MRKKLNFVYIGSDHMRAIEDQLSGQIAGHLPHWKFSHSVKDVCEGAVNFTFFMTRPSDLFMSHGLADKNYLFRRDAKGRPSIARYKRVLVPGRWHRDRILREFDGTIDPETIKIVGWPRLDLLRQQRESTPRPPSSGKKRVLWAPTLSGPSGSSSYPALMGCIPELRHRYDVSISTHPADRNGGVTTFEQLLAADVVISDSGTLLYEAWALGKPVVFPTWLIAEAIVREFPGSAEAYVFEQGLGVHAKDARDLSNCIGEAEIGGDVREFMGGYLSDDGASGQRAAHCVNEFYKQAKSQ